MISVLVLRVNYRGNAKACLVVRGVIGWGPLTARAGVGPGAVVVMGIGVGTEGSLLSIEEGPLSVVGEIIGLGVGQLFIGAIINLRETVPLLSFRVLVQW